MNQDAERLASRLLGTDRLVEGALVAVGTQDRVFRVKHIGASGKVFVEHDGRTIAIAAGACRVLLPSEVVRHESERSAATQRQQEKYFKSIRSFIRALNKVNTRR